MQAHSAITLNQLAVTGAFTLAPDGTGAVTIVNAAGLNLAASTMGGTFSGTATTGNITQTGALDIEGASNSGDQSGDGGGHRFKA